MNFSVNQTCKRFEVESKLKKFKMFNSASISYANMLKDNIQGNIAESDLKRVRTSNERISTVDNNGKFSKASGHFNSYFKLKINKTAQNSIV